MSPRRRPGNARWRAMPGVLSAVSAAVLLTSCKEQSVTASAARSAQDAAVPVTIASATREDVPVQLDAIGWVEAYSAVTIRPQVEGQLTEIHFDDGDEVRNGDLLFTIDPRPFIAELRLAEANLLKDQALARDARQEADRVAGLFVNQVAADRERDQAQANAEAVEAQVKADEAAIENAKLRLEYCTIRSPISGRAGKRLVDRGNIVKANDTELVTINQISPIYVTFSLAERHLSATREYLRSGPLPVTARLVDDKDTPASGRLTFVDNQVDNLTGMVRLRATFANEDRRLWPGQFVDVSLTLTSQPDAVVVPAPAIQTGQQGQFVFVVGGDDRVEMRTVTVGTTAGDRVVVTKGLEAGDVVVTDGQLRLTPGAKVNWKAPEDADRRGGP